MRRAQQVRSLGRSISRLSRFVNQLAREQLSCGPVTVQQCYTLEALAKGPLPMNALAADVALHQSTLTRLVEKLEAKKFVRRRRSPSNRRIVEVELTESGRWTYEALEKESSRLMSAVLDLIPRRQRTSVVEALEIVSGLLDPENEAFLDLLRGCCSWKQPPRAGRGGRDTGNPRKEKP